MTLTDMADHVVELIGSPDKASIAQAKKFLKSRYMMIYTAHLWEGGYAQEADDQLRHQGQEALAVPELPSGKCGVKGAATAAAGALGGYLVGLLEMSHFGNAFFNSATPASVILVRYK